MSDREEFTEKVQKSEARDIANVELAEIIDVEAVKPLMHDFNKLARMPIGINDLKGNVLVSTGWQDICTKFHRVHPEACKHCVESDTKLSAGALSGEFKLYKCKNNMWDIVTPIMVGDQNVGYIFSGQFFFDDEPLDYELFRSQARKYDFDEEEYIAALKKVPRLSREAVNTGMSFLMTFANMISQLNYSNIKLAKSLSERDTLLEELRKSESKYRHIVETANEGVWIFNSSFETIYVNEKMAQMLGYSREEMLGRFIWDFADEEDKNISQVKLANSKQGIDEVYELKLMRKEGSYVWFLVSAKAFFEKDGKFTGILGMFNDITERKQAEEALKKAHDNLEIKVKERTAELESAYRSLKESEERLAQAQELAHIGSWERDIVSNEYSWSDETYRIFGLRPQESKVNFHTFLNFVHPDDRNYLENAIKAALNGKPFSIDYRIILANGEKRIVHAKGEGVFDENNNPVRIIGTVQDITERKKAEEKLRESEEKYRNIVEIANEGILLIDAELRVTYYNKKLMEMLGYNSEECIGRPIWDFIREESKVAVKQNMEKRQHGINESYELELICKNGSSLWVLLNAKSLFDKDGKFTGSISMITDISKRKEAEEALANIETSRKKEIHHRIKNNLQVISSLLDLQAEQFKGRTDIKDSEVLESFKESQDRVISMALIHEELYKGGGFETLNFSPYIEELAENLFQSYRLGNTDIRLRLDLAENTFFDMDIAVPLGIIVNELVTNSFKHAFNDRNQGEIRIGLHREEEGECILCTNEDCSNTFTLTVSDNGVGIPEALDVEDIETLGMQLVTSLVDQLDGELELNRENGTEFIISFAIAEKNDQVSMTAQQ